MGEDSYRHGAARAARFIWAMTGKRHLAGPRPPPSSRSLKPTERTGEFVDAANLAQAALGVSPDAWRQSQGQGGDSALAASRTRPN
ncbi:hypothetical protein DFR50_11224 [Roseiarcus fermentans]|uniref:Uncharacterized protein n=1 Tax=Roseiarcus fermentans TaxID=1473586 RepID=A0A366FH46_9HYPH|nr:hypothetical protein [Roseiarcus fermentans]RBP13055.1 hypothetical protein DFR50_11224 [Roseiarcus fermentans]